MSSSSFPTHHAAVLHAAKDLRLEERHIWPPKPGYVQVEVVSTGLCGSDLHYYKHGRNGDFAVRQPLVLGHEAAGVVTAVGAGVTDFVVGQRVAIEAGIMCRECKFCKDGRYNLCKSMRFCSSAAAFPHVDGTLQTRMNHPAHVLHPLPDNCSFEKAALAEPLSVLVHASRRAALTKGQSVLVLGTGAIGILACALAKAMGASLIAAIDINEARLDFAKRSGFAQQVLCFPPADRPSTQDEQLRRAKENATKALTAFGKEDGFDVVFECSGAESSIQMSVHAAMTGGKVMLIGMGTRNVMMPMSAAALREVDIRGSFRYANTYPEALSLLSSSELENVEQLVTHRFGLRDTKKAFETLERGTDEAGRLVIKIMVGDSYS
ncbi:Sorbitol dehydrogenase [Leucoagaricus sp. SymC.cos]|nr:Sorbitol dehydrogenase [Leucoagaricus sp. SymC.cos]